MRPVSSPSSSTSVPPPSILPKRRRSNASVAPIFTAEQRQSAIDEQTHLINPAVHRPVYTPPPASPTSLPSRTSPSPSSAAQRHSPSSIALVETHWQQAEQPTDRPMDSTPLTEAGAYDDEEAAAAGGQQHSPQWQRSPRTGKNGKGRLKQQHKGIVVASSSPTSLDSSSPSDSSLSAMLRENCSRRGVLCLLCLVAVIVTAVAVPLLYLHFRAPAAPSPPPFSPYTTCDIFCTGPVLSAFQLAHLFNDSKTFVDLPLLSSPSEVYADFMKLSNLSLASLRAFLLQHFDTNTSDLLPWRIPDWQQSPPVLDSVSDPTFRHFTAELNHLWFVLGRELHPDVYEHPERHTLLPLAEPYMLVPGGRFREFYYWDSYWIVRGLLLCGMNSTARMVIDNLLHMVDEFGFVPNGSRQYYLTRSQPPFLSLMVDYYHNATGDDDWLRSVLPLLSREYEYWMKEGEHAIALQDSSNRTHWLNRYYASVQYPRPESYAEDVATARRLSQAAHGQPVDPSVNASSPSDPAFPSSPVPCENSTDPDCDTSDQWSPQAKLLFSELTASAETGWDFSSRWFADRRNLSSAETSHIIPVDLNAVLYAVERVLSKLHNMTNDSEQGLYYAVQAQQRLDGMYALLFDSSAYIWRDLDFVSGVQDGEVSLASNYIPLWAAAYDARVDVSRVIDGLIASRLLQAGGLLTSLDDIDQQWDCPNAWPPLQHMVFEGIANAAYTPANDTVRDALLSISASLAGPLPAPYSPLPLQQPASAFAASLGYYLSSSWLYGNAALFNSTRLMYEKYYALQRGTAGAGGEYPVQDGFGWTNGVALILLHQYGKLLNWTQVGSVQPPFEINGEYPCTANPLPPVHRRL